MKVRSLGALLAVAAAVAGAEPARAWDEVGHKVVARIAWEHMTPAARARAVQLLLAAPAGSGILELMPQDGRPLAERQRDLFVNTAYWADLIRDREHPGHRFAHSDWHYVNFFWEQRTPGGPFRDLPERGTAGELVRQVTRIDSALSDARRPAAERAVDLAWLLHLVGDGHQPLHNSARVTPLDPEGDRGGNSFRLAGLYPFNNLHGYWDALVGYASPWRATDRTEADYIGGVAARIAANHPRGRAGALRPGAFESWSREGVRVAQRTAFPAWLVRDRPVPVRYRAHAWAAGEPRVALAGYRLADVLNRHFGE